MRPNRDNKIKNRHVKRSIAVFALLLLQFPLIARAQSTLSITTTTIPAASAGIAYSVQLQATGGVPPYKWTISTGTLPAGLTLSTGGLISGIPGSAGTSNFTAQVTDSSGAVSGGGMITCVQGCSPAVLTNWNGGPGSIALPSAIGAGDVVVLMVEGDVAGNSFTIKPSSGTDTFTQLVTGQSSDTFQHGTIFYACNSSGGYKSVNGTWSGNNYGTVALLDLSGPVSFCVDGAGITNAGTGISPLIGPLNPSTANDFFFAILFNPYGDVITPTWTGATVLGTASYGNGIFLILNSTGNAPQSASGTMSSANWAAVIGAIKP